MRIAIGQLWQESNTFNPVPTTRRDFELFGVQRGTEFLEFIAGTNEPGGFIQALNAWPERPELVGLVRLPAWPSGLATAETFEWLKLEVIQSLNQAGPVDAVLLALHGALAAQDHPDVEGEILAAVRQIVGAKTPVVATLDLHANITPEMVSQADALVLYHTMPHVDTLQTGLRGAGVLRRILSGSRPITAFAKVPAVLPAERANTQKPGSFAAIRKQRLVTLEDSPKILTAGIATVQPWLDVPHLGSAVIVTTDGDQELAVQSCRKLAQEFWDSRADYLPELVPIDEAVRRANECTDGLTVLSDAADATTSGAPGDSVWILQELLKFRWRAAVLVPLVAPEVVEQARHIGAGHEIETTVGGRRDTRFGTCLSIRGHVERLFDAKFVLTGHLADRLSIDMGPSAVIRIHDIRLVITSHSGPHFAPQLFQTAGHDPFQAAVVVAKSPCGFRAVYENQAAQIFSVRAPGCAPSDFWNYPYRNLPRPIYPWDPIENWTPDIGVRV